MQLTRKLPPSTTRSLILTISVALATSGNGCSPPQEPSAAPTNQGTADPAGGAGAVVPRARGASISISPDEYRRLRHTVFFRFKESSSKEDVDKVVDAFQQLPEKIEEIVGFEWGENNSPENLNDGFTHCFVLTFEDDAGREVYLPHAAHKAFGDVLRPHMADVFVIDYSGWRLLPRLEEKLRHAVYLKFTDDAAKKDVEEIEKAFANLQTEIKEIKILEWGLNNSPEKHDDGFTHCFMLTFDSEEGRETYLKHEAHQAFGKKLGPVVDKVRVLDYWVRD